MKSITLIIFGLVFAIHCANGANIYDQVKANIATVKKNIKATADKVNKDVDQVIEQNQKLLTSNKNSALSLGQIKVNTEVTLINNAAENNKDCLKQYENEVNGAQSKCFTDVSSCFDKAADDIKSTKNDILPTIASINGLEMEIDRGTINCVGASTPIDYMVCVTKVLAQVNISLKAEDTKSQTVVNQIKTKAEAIRTSAPACSDGKLSTILIRLQSIRDNVKICVGSN